MFDLSGCCVFFKRHYPEGNKVVIVGGVIAGGLLAKELQHCPHISVTLIDPKEYFEISWANLRAMVEPSFAEKSVFNHSEYFVKGRLITSHAVDITEDEVLTADGQHVPYNYLVVATGKVGTYPKTRDERLKQYNAEHKKIKAANSILIVGGGPTGVELAGEIAVNFPKKKVTLVHKGSRLLQFVNRKASARALDWLISKNVEVLLEQTVDLYPEFDGERTIYQTSSGKSIIADGHFLCVGKPQSTWLRKTILQDSLDAQGRLMVDANLMVEDYDNIFAIGDITDVPEIKQGNLAQRHAHVTAKNIKLLYSGESGKLATYTPRKHKAKAIISLGRKEGIAQFPSMTISGWIPGMIKSRHLFVGKTRKTMGLRSHKTQNGN